MNVFENTPLKSLARVSALSGPNGISFEHATIAGELRINEETVPVDGTYPEVNRALRQLTAKVSGTFDGDVTFELEVTDQFGNETVLTETLNASSFPAAVSEREIDGETVQIVQNRSIPCPIQITDTFGTLSVETDVMVTAVKAEAGRRINEMFPAWRQSNAQARMIELLEKGKSNWSAAEKAEVETIRAGFDLLKTVRVKSDEIENLDQIPVDVWNDEHWS